MTGDLFAPSSAEKTQRSGGWINAHCDGGARGNPGPSGYGAVIVAEDGTPLAELSEFLGIRTNNFAEYSGLLGVLRWTLEHGYTKLRVVSDSELMVKQIQGRYKVNSPDLKPMHAEARNMIRQLDAFEISHALRHKNKQADKLANDAMDRGSKRAPNAPPLNATPYPSAKSAPTKTGPHRPTSQTRNATRHRERRSSRIPRPTPTARRRNSKSHPRIARPSRSTHTPVILSAHTRYPEHPHPSS